MKGRLALVLAAVAALALPLPAHAADEREVAELAGCSGSDPDCATPPAAPPTGGGGGGGTAAPEPPKLVAWSSAYDINPFNGGRGGIFISRTDGSGQRRLTEFDNGNKEFTPHGLNAPDDHPSFSPDGRQLVFSSNRANRDDWDVYVMDVNGANVRRLTSSPGLDTEPVFSPDGRHIAFASARGGTLGIWVMRADGSNPTVVVDTPIAEVEPAWRPDGTQLVYTRSVAEGDKDLFTVDVVVPRRVPPGFPEVVPGAIRQLTSSAGEDHDATYSPDGQEIVYTSEREPFSPPFGNTRKMRLDGLVDLGSLTNDLRLGAGDPHWSFDGRRIAFFKSSTRLLRSPQQLWVMAGDGTQKTHLPGGTGVANVHPATGRVADADGDGTADYLESGSVGRAIVRAPRRVRAGRRFVVRLGWRHPVRWRLMRSEHLVVTLDGDPIGLVRFDVPTRLFFLWRSADGRYGRHGRAGAARTLRAGALALNLRRTRVRAVSRRTLELRLALALGRRARGRTVRLETRADDARGNSQQDRRARARLRVR